jgi:NAD+ synthase (glutamine-hydrolysing)
MKIALAQLNYVIGDFEKNIFKIKENIRRAKKEQADVVIFSELAISGYPPRDFLEFRDFVARCSAAAEEIAAECIGIVAIVGCPTVNPKIEGKNLFNSAYILADGKIKDVVHKALLPNYDIFDEYRYFEPNHNFHCVEIKGVKVALTICEDLWNVEDDPMYVSCPMDILVKGNPQLMINIAASPFDYSHAEKRNQILASNAKQYSLPLIYLNHVGAQTELIFDGGSVIMNSDGATEYELEYFREDFFIVELDTKNWKLNDYEKRGQKWKTANKAERIHSALVLGIRDYFVKQNFSKAILGLSGGIDSAIVAFLAVEALGKENVLPVLMPSEFSSKGSINDSVFLCNNLGLKYKEISLANIFTEFLDSLKPHFENLSFNVTEENIQARARAVILMALSNKFGYILLNTSNKSELAVGYGTLYGDMAGGLSVIGDVYKTEVFELAHYINREKEIIPEAIINKPPSAELRANQKDSDSLPEYEILDPILYQYIERRRGPDELIKLGYDKALVDRILKLVNANEYKRYQTPPILRVSPKAFGSGRRLPIVGKYLS